MMKCTDAQMIISAAHDGEPRDGLEQAREHCRACPECVAFVTTLAAINRLPAPETPPEVLERTLAAVRREYPPAQTSDVETLAADTALTATPEVEDIRLRSRPWAPWAVAAAALFIVAGIVTAQGVRYLLQPSGIPVSDDVMVNDIRTGEVPAAEGDVSALEAPPEDFGAPGVPTGPAYIVFGQSVYRLTGTAESAPTGAQLGTVTSSLDTGDPATSVPVFADPASDAVVVMSEDDSYLRFEPVVRTLRGTPYALRSGDITAFGQWPSLPAGIPEPSAPDGSPVFIEAGTDDSGVTVYVRPGTDPAAGFAVAPGTPPGDPAAGNTGWTWWEPAR